MIGREVETGRLLSIFKDKLAVNAEAWIAFIATNKGNLRALDFEYQNLRKAAIQALKEKNSWEAGARLVVDLWRYIELRGRWLAWEPIMDHAISVSCSSGNRALEAQLLEQKSALALILRKPESARAFSDTALAIYLDSGNKDGEGRCLAQHGLISLSRSDLVAAERFCRDAERLFTEHGNQAGLGLVHNNWGMVCEEKGELEAAIYHYGRSETFHAAMGNIRGQAKAVNNQGRILYHHGRWDEAFSCYNRALGLHRNAGDVVNAARTQVNLAIVHHKMGQSETALKIHSRLEVTFRQVGDRLWLARVKNNQGVFLAALGRLSEARESFAYAVDLHLANGDLAYAADSLDWYSEAFFEAGIPDEALECFNRAGEILSKIERPPERILERHRILTSRLAESTAGVLK